MAPANIKISIMTLKTITAFAFLLLTSLILVNCGEETGVSDTNYELSLSTFAFDEGDINRMITLTMGISPTLSETLSLNYATKDETAVAGSDYLASSGTITFSPGSTQSTVEVEFIGDTNIELQKYFSITFTSPDKPGSSDKFNIQIINDDFDYSIADDEEGFITPDSYPSMTLVWSDEFNGPGLDLSNWTYEIGDGCDRGICGWGNEELEVYTDSESNVFTENGKLTIKATDDGACNCYESGRIITQDKREFKYGRIDIRARITEGQGLWPAIWMLGENINEVGWPVCGELDIMENIGNEPKKVHGTVHYDAGGYKSSTGSTSIGENFSEKFHVFSILWDLDKITWYVDYQPYKTLNKSMVGSTYPFNNSFFFIMNVAVGGLWPGSPDATTQFPQEMVIDYIRVFQ